MFFTGALLAAIFRVGELKFVTINSSSAQHSDGTVTAQNYSTIQKEQCHQYTHLKSFRYLHPDFETCQTKRKAF